MPTGIRRWGGGAGEEAEAGEENEDAEEDAEDAECLNSNNLTVAGGINPLVLCETCVLF